MRHVLASWFPVHIEGEITGVGVVVVDITDRKAAELRLQGVLQQLPVGVVIADADGPVLLGNEQLEAIGLTPPPARARTCRGGLRRPARRRRRVRARGVAAPRAR